MSELDEAWALGLAKAAASARAAGRKDIAEYLALRHSNDLMRTIGSEWLLTLFTTVAGEANRAGAAIQISTEPAHNFKVGHANMVGRRLSLASGVRILLVEAGWPRAPRDGFIRGGGLACANIKHRGIKSANEELRLIVDNGDTPSWVTQGRSQSAALHESNVRKHIAILLDDSRRSATVTP